MSTEETGSVYSWSQEGLGHLSPGVLSDIYLQWTARANQAPPLSSAMPSQLACLLLGQAETFWNILPPRTPTMSISSSLLGIWSPW